MANQSAGPAYSRLPPDLQHLASSGAHGLLSPGTTSSSPLAPPSPTLSKLSFDNVHFQGARVFRLNEPHPGPDGGKPSLFEPTKHARKGSITSYVTTVPDEKGMGQLSSSPTGTTAAATLISERKKTKRNEETDEQLPYHIDPSANTTDPTPFEQKPLVLASLIDPKSLQSLESMGGTEGLLRGLGVDSNHPRGWQYTDLGQKHGRKGSVASYPSTILVEKTVSQLYPPLTSTTAAAMPISEKKKPKKDEGIYPRLQFGSDYFRMPIHERQDSANRAHNLGREPNSTTLGSLGRQTLKGLKKVINSTGTLPGLSDIVGAFEKLQSEIEVQEARFQRHLDALSGIIDPYVQATAHVQKKGNSNSGLNNSSGLFELHSLIGSVRDALGSQASSAKPYSHILDAKGHQRRFERATDSLCHGINEWVVRSVTELERKFERIESHMRGLDDRIRGIHKFMQRDVFT